MSEDLARISFESHVNQRFGVRPIGQDVPEVDLVLVNVSGSRQGRMESLNLIFKGPGDALVERNNHRVRHPILGVFDLFLGPVVSPRPDGVYYEAVFNRFKP